LDNWISPADCVVKFRPRVQRVPLIEQEVHVQFAKNALSFEEKSLVVPGVVK
jgi:hypothetical protein